MIKKQIIKILKNIKKIHLYIFKNKEMISQLALNINILIY